MLRLPRRGGRSFDEVQCRLRRIDFTGTPKRASFGIRLSHSNATIIPEMKHPLQAGSCGSPRGSLRGPRCSHIRGSISWGAGEAKDTERALELSSSDRACADHRVPCAPEVCVYVQMSPRRGERVRHVMMPCASAVSVPGFRQGTRRALGAVCNCMTVDTHLAEVYAGSSMRFAHGGSFVVLLVMPMMLRDRDG